ncbi:MAG TPA: hypothetical protein VG929_04650 [Actinomycetota bacterium]|nr:hypothetical protein [Actinomycetota bacterium]
MTSNGSPKATGRFVLCLALLFSLALPASAQPSPSITIEPDCGPEATDQPDEPYEIVVEASGFEPGDDVEISFGGERQDDPDQEDVVADENGAFTTTIRSARRAAGTYEVEALQRDGEGTVSTRATAPFTVPCQEPEPTAEPTPEEPPPSPEATPTKKPQDKKDGRDRKKRPRFRPDLEIESPVAPPGSVMQVSGRKFPPATRLMLRWSEGIGTTEVRTSQEGRFKIGVLIFPNDILGPRQLVARGDRFRPVKVKVLVVPSTAAPPGFQR